MNTRADDFKRGDRVVFYQSVRPIVGTVIGRAGILFTIAWDGISDPGDYHTRHLRHLNVVDRLAELAP